MSGKSLPMSGIRNFIIGFCLSVFSVTLCERLTSSSPRNVRFSNKQNIRISLFKDHINSSISLPPLMLAEVKKLSLATPQSFNPIEVSPEGVEDDEIISINFDDQIPIEQEVSANDFEPSDFQNDNVPDASVAMLPNTEESSTSQDVPSVDDSPWVTAKTKKAAKNKNFTQMINNKNENLFTENLQQLTQNDEAVSYKVAERIKQSVIFPIPDEILNDENLTPTFIKGNSTPAKKANTKKQISQKDDTSSLQIKKEDTTFKKPSLNTISDTADTSTDASGILDSISSWFSSSKQNQTEDVAIEAPIAKKKKPAPTYETNTQSVSTQKISKTKQEELVDFYSSLQETRQEYAQRKIIPSELKLSFQPGKAEISGTTLTWLKAFSEAATSDDIRLQVRLDASVATELQKKRLNLLYTIFMNNGVDFKKVDTVFSTTEPNALIIRTIRIK